MDDSPWLGPNHILVPMGCAHCSWLKCCLIVCTMSFCPTFIPLSACCMSFSDFSFPTHGRPALAHRYLCGNAHGLWLGWHDHLPWWSLCKKSPPIILMPFDWLPWTLILRLWWCCICSLSSMWWVCQSSLPVWYRNVPCGHHCWVWLLHHASKPPILSLDCYCRSCNKDRRIFLVSLPYHIFFGGPPQPHNVYCHCVY